MKKTVQVVPACASNVINLRDFVDDFVFLIKEESQQTGATNTKFLLLQNDKYNLT